MKLFISILLAMTCQLTFAAGSKDDHKEGAKAHKDWNEVFKQPMSNTALSQIPDQTQLLEPAFLTQVKGNEVTLKWKSIEGVKYHLQVATDQNFKWLVVNDHLVTYTEYALKNLQPNQQYFWRVFTQKPENMLSYTKGLAVSSAFETAVQ